MTNPTLLILTIPLVVIAGLIFVSSVILVVWGAQALIKSRWKVCVFSDRKCEWAGNTQKHDHCDCCPYWPLRRK